MTNRKFNPSHMTALDSEKRKEMLPVEKIIEAVDLPEGANIADIGCGTGYLTIPLARKAPQCQVFAVDIEPGMLSVLAERAKGLDNITIVHSTENDIPVADNILDISFLSAVLHELHNPEDFLKEIRRMSRLEHYVAVVDWNEKKTDMGPPMHIRIPKDTAISLFRAHGYELAKEFAPSEYFYGLLFQRKK
ncbi:MAG TPA: class I SAM-dependent methyltransferase [Proteobacteria bacterium]|nr:class I SAM-dependent methyltransferase [Pseudomonadota bacterium]